MRRVAVWLRKVQARSWPAPYDAPVPKGYVRARVELEGHVNLAWNPSHAAEQLHLLRAAVETSSARQAPTSLYLDLSRVEALDSASIAYMMALLAWADCRADFHAAGVCSKAARVNEALDDLGFWRRLGVPSPVVRRAQTHRKCLQLISGSRVENYEGLWKFLESGLSYPDRQKLWDALTEFVMNAVDHGLSGSIGSRPRRWFGVGWTRQGHSIQATLVDLGVGFSATLRRRWIGEAVKGDDAWLLLATTGKRHASGRSERGYGLFKLAEFVRAGAGRTLRIWSGKGMLTINSKDEQAVRLPRRVLGSVIQLELSASGGSP